MNLQQWRNLFLNWVGLMLVEQRCEVESGVVVVVVVVAWPQSSFVVFKAKSYNGSKRW